MEIINIWNKALVLLKEDVAEAPYTSFIEPLKPVSLDMQEKTLVLKTQNEFCIERLDRYKNIIETILKEVSGEELRCAFVIKAEENDDDKDKSEENDTLNSKYTFENFITGKSNYYARAGAVAVSKSPGTVYNPLFFYGGAGLGKTHLAIAIGNKIKSNFSHMNVMYIPSETFTNEMINSIKNGSMEKFRERYRTIDVLIIDDIQFFSNKEAVQEEFFHTFEELIRLGKQIVITSDKKPDELQNFDERLTTRFKWSLVADITSPDVETRNAILLKKAEEMELEMNDDLNEVINFIADKVQFNVRELEGALTRVLALSKVDNVPITLEYAQKCLKNIYVYQENDITVDAIMRVVSEHFGITVDELTSASRKRNLAYPRQISMFLCRQLTNKSLPKIGEEFQRDHSTVMHSCDKIDAEIKVNENLRNIIMELSEKLKS